MTETKQRPTLSVLLAIKGLVPLEADCADRVEVDTADTLVICRYYQGNPEFCRRIKLPAGAVKPYEYEEMPFRREYSFSKKKWLFTPLTD